MQVLKGVGDGLTTKEIAHHLKLTPKGVEGHRMKIYHIFKVDNQVKLARIAIAFGLSPLCLMLMVGCASAPVTLPAAPPPPPATSMMLLAKPQKSTTVTMGWNMVSLARDYSLLWSTNHNFANSSVALITGGHTQIELTGLTVGRGYYFAVRANVNGVQSYPSAPVFWKAINWSGNSPAPIP